jgi:LacI family transcriptional regulator
MRDVAARAGVSVMTVSNVLNRPEAVSPATRDRVLAAIGELGFVRNESARRLRAGRSSTLGLVLLDLNSPVFALIARSVEDVANAHGLEVMLGTTDGRPDREANYLSALAEQGARGVLITPTDAAGPQIQQLRRRGIPVVLLDRAAGSTDECSVSVDEHLGGRLAAAHLLERGHRRIALVGGSPTSPLVQARLAGATAAVREAGADHDLTVLCADAATVASGRDGGAQLLGIRLDRRPTGVVCANDEVALGLLQQLVRHGAHVPEDFAIVGYDDIEYARAAAVPLTSVRRRSQEVAHRAAELLLDESNNESHVHEQLVLEPVLVGRDSTIARRSVVARDA